MRGAMVADGAESQSEVLSPKESNAEGAVLITCDRGEGDMYGLANFSRPDLGCIDTAPSEI